MSLSEEVLSGVDMAGGGVTPPRHLGRNMRSIIEFPRAYDASKVGGRVVFGIT